MAVKTTSWSCPVINAQAFNNDCSAHITYLNKVCLPLREDLKFTQNKYHKPSTYTDQEIILIFYEEVAEVFSQ